MKELVAVLNSIRSLHNVGSIFRTADAAGVSKIYLCGITPTPLDRFGKPRPRLAKVSLGAEESVAYEKAGSIAALIERLKAEGYKIFALELTRRAEDYRRFERAAAKHKIALVLGNEVRGLPPAVLRAADRVLAIPMRGRKESLNVAVAFGVAVYRLIR